MRRRGLSLGWRMVLLVAGIPLLVLTPLLLFVGQQYRTAYRGAFWSKANLATIQVEQTLDAIAPFVETLDDAPGIARLLQDTDENVEDFDFIALVDPSGRIIESSLPGYTGRTFTQLSRLELGATPQGEGDEAYAVVRRDLGFGDTYLVWRSMAMPGSPDDVLYVVVSERADVVEPPLLPLIIIGVAAGAGVVVLIRMSLYRLVLRPLNSLAEGVAVVGAGDLMHRIVLEREDEFGFVARAFNEMTARVADLVSGLGQRVEERTAALQRRNAQLEAVSIVGQVAARQRNVNALLDAAVTAISANFGFYHTGIFILDDNREWAILRAASSEGGKRMLARGHRLQVGRVGIVGYVAENARPRIAFNVGQDAVWFQNPDLPRTQAEMALPLVSEDGVVGVLDVQSDRAGTEPSFTDEDISTLQLMADQLTVALMNARALETTKAALEELRALQIDYSRRGWARVTQRTRPMAYEYDRVDVTPVPPLPVPDELVEGRVPYKIVMDGGAPVVMEALRIGGRTLGYLGLSDPQRSWSEEELSLINSVGEQVALALDNARLFEDAQSNERQQYLISRVLQVASSPEFDAEQVLNEIARILAQGLDMVVVIFTFPYPSQPVVRSHAVVDPDGRQLRLFEDDLTLSQEHFIFFQGLETADLGPMAPLLGSGGAQAEEGDAPTELHVRVERLAGLYDFERVLYVPIQSGGVRTGCIGFIQRQAAPPLDPDTRDLALSLASQVSVVLENLNLTEETRQRSEELRQLYRISLALSEQLGPEDVLNLIVSQGTSLLGADGANLWIVESSSDGPPTGSAQTLRLAYDYGGGAEDHLGFTSSGDQGLAGAALGGQKTIIVDDYATWERCISELVSTRFHGMMAVPLVGRFGPLGVFVALSEKTEAFGEREAGLADLFSAQAATALENAQLNEDAQRRAEEFSQLYQAGIDLVTILDAEELLGRAADWAREIFDAERAVVFLRDPQSGRFVPGISASDPQYLFSHESDQPSTGGFTETIIRTRESVLVPDNRTSPVPSAERLVDVGLLSQIGTPLRIGDEVLGALFVNGAAAGQFGEGDVALLEFLSAQVSSALQNSIQFGQTEQALAVVGRQARYQANVSQAVALLNDRGTEATGEVLRLLGEAAEVSVVAYVADGGLNGEPAWCLAESWVAEGRSSVDLEDFAQRSLAAELQPWVENLAEKGQVMLVRDDPLAAELASLVSFEFGAVLGLGVPGQGKHPGFVALFRDEAELWSDQDVVALQTVAAALSNTLARETLFQQVQETLSETEALYRGSAALSEANTYEDILGVLLAHTVLGRDTQTATMVLFDQPWSGEQRPASSELVAYWGQVPETDLRRRYQVDRFPAALHVLQDGSPLFVEDLKVDKVLDRRAHALFRRVMGAGSVVIMPLVVGGQRIGFLHAGYADPQIFSGAERRQLVSLAQQAAIAVLNIRQLRATEARARREQLIRQITGRIQEAPDVDGVLQTAVREVGRALGTSKNRIQFHPPQGTVSPSPVSDVTDASVGDGNGNDASDDPTDSRDLGVDEG